MRPIKAKGRSDANLFVAFTRSTAMQIYRGQHVEFGSGNQRRGWRSHGSRYLEDAWLRRCSYD
ncbi:hypothetical protein A2U01_0061561, partial [Trifolium medium]|nr:hypothetical protein [Trifolium medium]